MPDATDALAAGSEIGGYRIEREIGRGGMSIVYLATHLVLDREVALKVLAPALADDDRFRERFVRESRLAASLEHPNIVPIYDADEIDGLLYIAMRYVAGTDLHELIRAEGVLTPARTVAIVDQIASALDAAHAHDLVHRDVKPANVLLSGGEHVYLTDFGLTRRTLSESALTASGALLGTIDYVAPEQIEGGPVDARADVYALGCIAYRCLTGEVPYPRESDMAVLWAHVQDPPPRPTSVRPELPTAVDAVIAYAMAKDPVARTTSAEAVARGLRTALGPNVPSGAVTAPVPEGRHPIRVVIADDHPVWRDGVREDLEGSGRASVVGEAADGGDAIDVVLTEMPDVVLMDLRMPTVSGVDAIRRIAEAAPDVQVLVLSASGEEADVLEAVKAGASGYLLKSSTRAEIVDAIARVNAGEPVFSAPLASLVLSEFRRVSAEARPPGEPGLTERENEVLRLVAKGYTYREIGERLFISEKTAQNHVRNILTKLQLRKRYELMRFAIQKGLDRAPE